MYDMGTVSICKNMNRADIYKTIYDASLIT